MNNVVCISGYCPDLGKDHGTQIRKWFDEYFKKDYVVIGHVIDHHHKRTLMNTFPDAIVQIEENIPIKDYNIPNKGFITGLQRYLQQIHSYRKVNALRKTILIPRDTDRVVRCRYDLRFYTDPSLAGIITNDEIGIPDFHHWGGYNDRMAIMGGNVADSYLNIISALLKNRKRCTHPERNLKMILDEEGVKTKMMNIKFNRVRNQDTELNDCKINQAWIS
jgi:hypothetical protein